MKVCFNYKVEAGQNPYSGITSFQHFRGEKLYSDCIVPQEGIAGTETENYECYPVTEGVEELGRSQGYYPDTSVAYIRILWKEFEPEQGVFNFDFIEGILNDAKAHNQSLMFRLMPHSTCERDDLPNWFKKIVPCPARPDGMRVKDSPTDPRFLKMFGNAIKVFGERFDSNETLDIIDVCLPGSWGEGHKLENYPKQDLMDFVDIYLSVFKNTKLVGQMGLPWLIEYANKVAPIGWRGDGTGSPKHMNEIFPDRISKLNPDIYKTAPISFESYWWLGEWYRRGWDIDEIIEKTLSWNITNFNPKSLPIPYIWKDKIDYWVSKMGYHYQINSVENANYNNGLLNFTFNVENVGVAPIYNKLNLVFKVVGDTETEVISNVDIRKWLPGKISEDITLNLGNLNKGEYTVKVAINKGSVFAYFATDAEFDGLYYTLFTFKV